MIDVTGIKFVGIIIICLMMIWGSPTLGVAQSVSTLIILGLFAVMYYHANSAE
jgi:hypothetical protein